MSRPEPNMSGLSLAANDRSRRRAAITLDDIREADGKAISEPKTVSQEASKPGRGKAKKEKAAADPKVVVTFRVAPEIHAELVRIAGMHGQPQSYAMRKVLEQWISQSQEKREEILKT